MKRRDIAYEVGDKVFLKVSPWRKILRFGKRGKLSPRFIGSYEVFEQIGHVAYRLALPPEFSKLHNMFHVSMLRRYHSDESHILPMQNVQVQADLSYDKEPKAIMAREMKQLRNKQVPFCESALETPWQGRSYFGARSNYENAVFTTLHYR